MVSRKKATSSRQKKKKIELPDLPEEILIDNILTRLPARILAKWSCVCKLWYHSTYNGERFAELHLVRNQAKEKLFLLFINTWIEGCRKTCFFNLDDDYQHRLSVSIGSPRETELVGYANGLACITSVDKEADTGMRSMVVVNPTRREILNLHYSYPRTDVGCDYLCHGFGFNGETQDYKLVIVFTSKANDEFICMVFTLGTNSWRNIVTSLADISPPPGSSPFRSRMVTRVSGNIRTPATLCGGHLFWRISALVEDEEVIINNHRGYELYYNNNKRDMLLSFDIHSEKIQFIRLPDECKLTKTPKPILVVEHHLLEHKGYLCFARSEKAKRNHMNYRLCQSSLACHCRFVVQLYMLKDTVKQEWIKGETLGFQVEQLNLPPAPFCCYLDTLTPVTLPTRLLSFCDQVLLHWFDGECVKFYNLQTERLEVVRSSSSSHEVSRCTFERKLGEFGGDDTFHRSYMHYQLHSQVENIRSLKTYIPAGEVFEFDGLDDFLRFYRSNWNKPTGWVTTVWESVKYRAFF